MPEILASDLKDQSVYESTPVTFEVIAQGIPKPEAQWTLNGEHLIPNDHYTITEDDLRYKLSIDDVYKGDKGQISVVIKNRLGELTKQCTLDVMRKYLCYLCYECKPTYAKLSFNQFSKFVR